MAAGNGPGLAGRPGRGQQSHQGTHGDALERWRTAATIVSVLAYITGCFLVWYFELIGPR